MAAITPAVDLQLLQDNFNLAQGLPPNCCSNATAHAELDVCVVNPIFSKSVGALLAGRNCRERAVYAAVHSVGQDSGSLAEPSSHNQRTR
jgi:hypothetical protein